MKLVSTDNPAAPIFQIEIDEPNGRTCASGVIREERGRYACPKLAVRYNASGSMEAFRALQPRCDFCLIAIALPSAAE